MAEVSDRKVQDIILDSIADGVFTIDSDGRITSFNRAAEEITGRPRSQAIGQKCFDVFQANICQTACALRETMESGQRVIDRRINILNSRGERVPVSISTSVLLDEQGVAVGGVETFRDLSMIERLRKEICDRYTFQDIISKNHQMRRVLEILPDIAASDCTVLIEGPTGSGKELVARAIHNLSRRAKRRFVAVNCGALPDTLLESELFGYKKGAFTDAKTDKPGRFALAEKGTLFLDEIADVSKALQVKLLRVLQEREYEPLGATASVKADVRVIAATNKPLAEQLARGAIREDLYYRLNVVRIALPSLAERREDIPLLVNHFIALFNAEQGRRVDGISEEALAVIMRHSFPGNVRELRNIIEHAMVLCRGERIEVQCLPAELRRGVACETPPPLAAARGPLESAEAASILSTLREHGGHRARTAAALGIDTSTLWRKMKKFGITYP